MRVWHPHILPFHYEASAQKKIYQHLLKSHFPKYMHALYTTAEADHRLSVLSTRKMALSDSQTKD